MSIIDTVLDRTKGTRWYSVFTGLMLAAALWTFTGPMINWVVLSYAGEQLDVMLQQRGITKQSFSEVQKKLSEVDLQTDGLKTRMTAIENALIGLTNNQAAVARELKEYKEITQAERKETKGTIDNIYTYLLTGRRNP